MTDKNTLPCPFCGYNDVRVSIENTEFGKFAECVCEICGARVGGLGVMAPEDGVPADDLVASAIHAWNTRKEPQPEEPSND